jgi:hypothetical protein
MKREHIFKHYEEDAHRHWKLNEGGYAGDMSVRQGDELTLHISNARSYYDIHIFHEGASRELVHTIRGLRGGMQPVPEAGSRDGFGWRATASLRVPDAWASGVYLATFPTGQGLREALFVVRPRRPRGDILLAIEANTYAAYNPVGGACLFPYISRDRAWTKTVSLQRPLQPDFMGGFYAWDQFFCTWLAAEGFEVDYCINMDLDQDPGLLRDYKTHLRVGHGEYVSRAECEALQAFVRRGGNLAVFAGNAFWHEVETVGRHQVYCDKTRYAEKPLGDAEGKTSFLMNVEQLRQRTVGLHYTAATHSPTDVPGDFSVPDTSAAGLAAGQHFEASPLAPDSPYGFYRTHRPEHWVFAGTGLGVGDRFGEEDSIVGNEVDGGDVVFDASGLPAFSGRDGISAHYRVLALGDATGGVLNVQMGVERDQFYSTVAINETEFAGGVFVAATMEWAHGLYRDGSAVAAITRNVLRRFNGGPSGRVASKL